MEELIKFIDNLNPDNSKLFGGLFDDNNYKLIYEKIEKIDKSSISNRHVDNLLDSIIKMINRYEEIIINCPTSYNIFKIFKLVFIKKYFQKYEITIDKYLEKINNVISYNFYKIQYNNLFSDKKINNINRLNKLLSLKNNNRISLKYFYSQLDNLFTLTFLQKEIDLLDIIKNNYRINNIKFKNTHKGRFHIWNTIKINKNEEFNNSDFLKILIYNLKFPINTINNILFFIRDPFILKLILRNKPINIDEQLLFIMQNLDKYYEYNKNINANYPTFLEYYNKNKQTFDILNQLNGNFDDTFEPTDNNFDDNFEPTDNNFDDTFELTGDINYPEYFVSDYDILNNIKIILNYCDDIINIKNKFDKIKSDNNFCDQISKLISKKILF